MAVQQSDLEELISQGYNRVPLMREVLADLDTPLSTYLKLADGPYSYLFESVQGGEKWGRYSIIGLPAKSVFKVRGNVVTLEVGGEVVEHRQVDDPLEEVERLQESYIVPMLEGLPRFTGGLVGYFGYDTIRYIEPHLGSSQKPDPIGAPDILLMVSEEVVVFDNLSGRLFIIVHIDPSVPDSWESGNRRLDELVLALSDDLPRPLRPEHPRIVNEDDFESGFPRADFEDAVEQAREYITNGDIFQVVLSQRLSVPFTSEPINLYRALRTMNPSPYMVYMNLENERVIGSSPEILVRLEDGEVTVRPIAGTRRRGVDEREDEALAEELLSDPKELAEHLMLLDLGRNDVGRVAQIGTVVMTEQMVVERYSHVMHIVSNVVGELASEASAIDVLRATFPAGTVSGAPKVRALEIIDELEPVKRGIYSGAIGYIGWNGNMDTCIAIRTAVVSDNILHIQAGAGIVADSIPEQEWNETMNKGRVIFRAVAMACAGLDGVA
ncbi:MAG: anthranilate synthase component I [Acidiferrobacteraceae bacterium]|jgi:anthranilate synthase component 1|nr:anthranilate synthase component I [Acidiferrobacteraceae bacterium]MDP6433978.1 anthranilate synthase component I [Arenicellales bacterium]MDP6671983.1 anthranilate synthase component I [Arenicellales bacterium]MDP6725316.1 anthranilate synthase component I [Arenicellales bacterium]|tara:strand:- start:5130 stop:6620 length:1491 start_codon:yes stop_codon:yes gene_type:complete